MTTQLTIASEFGPLADLEVLRTTGLRTFEACPHNWAMDFLRPGITGRESAASKIGTAAHTIVERMAQAVLGEAVNEAEIIECWRKIPEDEADNLSEYSDQITSLVASAKGVVGIEREFRHYMPGVGKPIKGTIDLALDMGEGRLLIVDHKTNREYKGKEYWQADLQPLIYAWGSRKEWPEFTSVHYFLGHINIGIHPRWETSQAEDAPLEKRVLGLWKRMVAYDKSGVWPKTVHDNCKWCPAYETCKTRKEASAKFMTTINVAMSNTPTGVKLQYAEAIAKMVNAKVDELKEEMRREVVAAGSIVHGDHEWSLKPTSTRKIPAEGAFKAFRKFANECTHEEFDEFVKLLDSLLTAKVGGMDKIKKKLPALFEALNKIVVDVPGTPKLESRPLMPSESTELVATNKEADFG